MWKQVDLLKKRYVVLVSGYKILLGGATEIDLDARLGAMTALGSAQRSSRTALQLGIRSLDSFSFTEDLAQSAGVRLSG